MSYTSEIGTVSVPIEMATADARVTYLKKVYGLTFLGLIVAAVSAFLMINFIGRTPALQSPTASLVVILGCWAVANFVAPRIAANPSTAALGFAMGAIFEGAAMGYLLLTAIAVSSVRFANPFYLINLAMLLTAATAGGLSLYVWTSPKDFKWAGAITSAAFVPMLILMAVGFAFPGLFGGGFGIIVSVVFVAISVIGLLYQTRVVMKELDTSQVYPGALMITLGILILFWNLLTLLLRLTSRD